MYPSATPPPFYPRVSTYQTEKHIMLTTHSVCWGSAREPNGPHFVYLLDVDNRLLGESLRQCLKGSRQIDVEEIPIFFDLKRTKADYENWVTSLLETGAYRSRRALFKNMMHCSVQQKNSEIIIQPNHHIKLEGWSGGKDLENVIIPTSCNDANLGEALREGFKRCY